MSYRAPAHREAAVKEAKNAMLASRRAVLTTHLNADGDGAGSEAALASWLRANGTEAWIINPTPFPDSFRFLIESDDWIVPAGSARARDLCDQADLAIVVDTGEVSRIGRVQELIRELQTVVIDHHPTGDHPIGGISLQDTGACATGELVFEVIEAANGPWTEQVAQGIYVAILTDTGAFHHANITARTFDICRQVADAGVSPAAVAAQVYQNGSMGKLRLTGALLDRMTLEANGRVAVLQVDEALLDETGGAADDMEGLINLPLAAGRVQAVVLFKDFEDALRVSVRSKGRIDVRAVAVAHGGGGHRNAAGFSLAGPVETARAKVVADIVAAVNAAADA